MRVLIRPTATPWHYDGGWRAAAAARRGARMLEKVLRSALGNAMDPDQNSGQGARIEQLVVRDARVDGGPMFKRMRPRARGMAHVIKKRTSHIIIELE